jgi:hypothetical protein
LKQHQAGVGAKELCRKHVTCSPEKPPFRG